MRSQDHATPAGAAARDHSLAPREGVKSSVGGVFIDAYTDLQRAEIDLQNFIESIGVKARWEGVEADFYDDSLEFRSVDDDLRFTPEQAAALLATGVAKFWLNHEDHTETFYSPTCLQGSHTTRSRDRLWANIIGRVTGFTPANSALSRPAPPPDDASGLNPKETAP